MKEWTEFEITNMLMRIRKQEINGRVNKLIEGK